MKEYLLTEEEAILAFKDWLSKNRDIDLTTGGTMYLKRMFWGGYKVVWVKN